MLTPTLGKTAKAAIYHVIYKGEVVRVGETINMRKRLSNYRSKAKHRKKPLPMHIAINEDWENVTFKIVMYVPYAERLTWEANEKKFYGTGSKWNGHEKEETHTNACVANGEKNMAKMPKEILIANGKNFDPELRKANGRKNGKKTGAANLKKIPKETLKANAARIPKEILSANGRNTKNGGNLNSKIKMRRQAIERYAKSGVLMKPYFFEPLFDGDETDWAAYIKEQLSLNKGAKV